MRRARGEQLEQRLHRRGGRWLEERGDRGVTGADPLGDEGQEPLLAEGAEQRSGGPLPALPLRDPDSGEEARPPRRKMRDEEQ